MLSDVDYGLLSVLIIHSRGTPMTRHVVFQPRSIITSLYNTIPLVSGFGHSIITRAGSCNRTQVWICCVVEGLWMLCVVTLLICRIIVPCLFMAQQSPAGLFPGDKPSQDYHSWSFEQIIHYIHCSCHGRDCYLLLGSVYDSATETNRDPSLICRIIH